MFACFRWWGLFPIGPAVSLVAGRPGFQHVLMVSLQWMGGDGIVMVLVMVDDGGSGGSAWVMMMMMVVAVPRWYVVT